MTRGRLPSVPELDERLRKLEQERHTDPDIHVPRTLTTTPPAVQWLQRRAVKWQLRILLALLVGAAGAAGGWIARDCQQAVSRSK